MIRMAIQVVLIDEAQDRRDVNEIARIDRAGLCAEALGLSLAEGKEISGGIQRVLAGAQVAEWQEAQRTCPECGRRGPCGAAKLATYSTWIPRTAKIGLGTMELEFYDYVTPEGAAEIVSHPDDPRAREMRDRLLNDLIPNELRERLPGALGEAQELSKRAYLFVEHQVLDPNSGEPVRELLGRLGCSLPSRPTERNSGPCGLAARPVPSI
jgi:hypothetical protein